MRPHFVVTQREYPDLTDVYREHRTIVDIIRKGDLEAAVRALLENIS